MDINPVTNPVVAVAAQQYQLDIQSRNSAFADEQMRRSVENSQHRDEQLTSDAITAVHASISVYA